MPKIPFLVSKLTVPPLSRRHIARPRLVETIDIFLSRSSRMVLVTAPAGYGKTTLLSEWIHTSPYVRAQGVRVHWIAFDKEEVDVRTFVLLLMSALVTDPPALEALAEQSERAQNQQEWLQVLSDTTRLVSREPAVLVMDDYPWTANDLFQSFLKSLPASFQVVISSRLRPAAWIMRFRLEWQVAEITQLDLRFQDDETRALLEAETRHEVDRKTAEQLAHRTEGWPVALQLATWRIHPGTDPLEAIQRLNGNDQLLLEYLMSEVYQKQTPENRRFLRQTAILPRLNPEVCDAIRERSDSAALLRELSQANVFLAAQDNENRWYRYHALFEDFLYRRLLEEDGPETAKRLHHLASEWYGRQQNATREAANQARLAGDYTRVVRLMETGTLEDVWNTNYAVVLDLLSQVPLEEFLTSPWLSILTTWALSILGSTVIGRNNKEWLEISKTSLAQKAREPGCDPAWVESIRAEIELLEILVNCPPLQEPPERLKGAIQRHLLAEMVYRVHESTRYKLLGDERSAVQTLHDGYLSSRLNGNLILTQFFKSILIHENVRLGRFAEAQRLLDEPENWVDGSASLFSLQAQVRIDQGQLAIQKNQLEIAGQTLDELAGKYAILSQPEKYAFSVFQVQYALALEDWQCAHNALTGAFLAARELSTPIDQGTLLYLNGLLDLRQGNVGRVRQWLSVPAGRDTLFRKSLETYRLLLSCRSQVENASQGAQSSPQETRKMIGLLDQAISATDVEYSPLLWAELHVVKALLLHTLDEPLAAQETLASTLPLAARCDYRRLFLDEGAPMKTLLASLAQKRVEAGFCNQLVRSFTARAPVPAVEEQAPSGEAVVTRREREILYYLAQGESNNEIAARLTVSLATVKKHLANIYRKMGVTSRRQAVKTARDKGWIKEIHLKG